MWQTLVILILLGAILVYLIRHYVRMYRCSSSACSSCSGCGAQAVIEKAEDKSKELTDQGAEDREI
jgi:hypothetical protein